MFVSLLQGLCSLVPPDVLSTVGPVRTECVCVTYKCACIVSRCIDKFSYDPIRYNQIVFAELVSSILHYVSWFSHARLQQVLAPLFRNIYGRLGSLKACLLANRAVNHLNVPSNSKPLLVSIAWILVAALIRSRSISMCRKSAGFG